MQSEVGPVDDARAVVAGRLRARRDEFVREIFARVRSEEFDRAGEDDAEYVAGLRATVAAALEYVFEGIERGEDGVGSIPVVALAQARRAARVGVSLDTVLRRYVVGSALLGEFIMQEAERGDLADEREALRGALRVQALGLERLLQAITKAYGDELARGGRSPQRQRYELVRRLLNGGAVAGAELGYELEGWHLGLVATGAAAERTVRELAASVDRRLLSVAQGEGSVWAWFGGGERLVVAEIERALATTPAGEAGRPRGEAAAPAGAGVVLAAGEPGWGVEGWRLTHRQARAALLVALRCPQRFTRYADVALLATALKDEGLARALIDVYVAPLEDSHNRGLVLRETLRAYLGAERSVSSAAAALGVARKTIEARLRTIEERLGRPLRPCPVELEVALLLDELNPTPTPPPVPGGISTAGEIST